MGFIKTTTIFENQITVKDAYHRIINYAGDRTVNIVIGVFESRAASDQGKSPIETKGFNFMPEYGDLAGDIKRQGYEYIKTLQHYSDVTDILE